MESDDAEDLHMFSKAELEQKNADELRSLIIDLQARLRKSESSNGGVKRKRTAQDDGTMFAGRQTVCLFLALSPACLIAVFKFVDKLIYRKSKGKAIKD